MLVSADLGRKCRGVVAEVPTITLYPRHRYPSPDGGIGRREGFKIPCPKGRVGSSPTPGTVTSATSASPCCFPISRFAPGNRIVASLWMLCGLPEAASRSSSLLAPALASLVRIQIAVCLYTH